jgi:hypothetical protein
VVICARIGAEMTSPAAFPPSTVAGRLFSQPVFHGPSLAKLASDLAVIGDFALL